MKKFIIQTLLFLTPLLFLGIVLEILLRNIPNDYKIKENYLTQHGAEIKTLVLGSSHAYRGFDPDMFSTHTFNASNVAQTIDYDYAILNKHINELENLENVILTISNFTYFSQIQSSQEKWRVKNYQIYYGIKNNYNLYNDFEITSNKLKVNYLRLKNYWLNEKQNICLPNGYAPNFGTFEDKTFDESGLEAASRHNIKSKFYFKENTEYLYKILDLASQRNIRVYLVTTPTDSIYYKNLNKEQLELTIKTTDSICQKFENCIYYNFLKDNRFIRNDFKNADHLNDNGAKKLSGIINEILTK